MIVSIVRRRSSLSVAMDAASVSLVTAGRLVPVLKVYNTTIIINTHLHPTELSLILPGKVLAQSAVQRFLSRP